MILTDAGKLYTAVYLKLELSLKSIHIYLHQFQLQNPIWMSHYDWTVTVIVNMTNCQLDFLAKESFDGLVIA